MKKRRNGRSEQLKMNLMSAFRTYAHYTHNTYASSFICTRRESGGKKEKERAAAAANEEEFGRVKMGKNKELLLCTVKIKHFSQNIAIHIYIRACMQHANFNAKERNNEQPKNGRWNK